MTSIPTRALALALAMLALTPWAEAAPVTYACKIVQGAKELGMFPDVDQVVVDVEAKVIELRVARTMGTSVPVNWFFMNREGEEFMIRRNASGIITAAGFNQAGSYAFTLNSGILMFSSAFVVPALAFAWECTE